MSYQAKLEHAMESLAAAIGINSYVFFTKDDARNYEKICTPAIIAKFNALRRGWVLYFAREDAVSGDPRMAGGIERQEYRLVYTPLIGDEKQGFRSEAFYGVIYGLLLSEKQSFFEPIRKYITKLAAPSIMDEQEMDEEEKEEAAPIKKSRKAKITA